MKLLYQAANTVEAHMLLHLLEQEHLTARIDGEYLQGGIGDLPAFGLIRIMVAEDDFARANAIVTQWDAAQPADPAPAPLPAARGGRGVAFAAGLLLGVLCTAAYFGAPLKCSAVEPDGVVAQGVVQSAGRL